MRKRIIKIVTLELKAGLADPMSRMWSGFARYGFSITEFCRQFNKHTNDKKGVPFTVEMTLYADRGFSYKLHEIDAKDSIVTMLNKRSDTPVMMFPVKLETKYSLPSDDGEHALRVRVFPDAITVRTAFEKLTEDEKSAGELFWNNIWAINHSSSDASTRYAGVKPHWNKIALNLGAARAAYLIKKLKPVVDPFIGKNETQDKLLFPDLTTIDESWFPTQCLEMLPDRFSFIGIKEGCTNRVVTGKLIDASVRTLSFESENTQNDGGIQSLLHSSSAKWITDYAEAEKLGMAITINSKNIADITFDRIVVLGVNSESDIKNLFEAHLWGSDNFAIVPVGTATNNTKKAKTGISEDDDLNDHFFDCQIKAILDNSVKIKNIDHSDGSLLAPVLRLEQDQIETIVNSSGSSINNAKQMNRALFDTSIGNFLSEMCATFVNHDSISKTKAFYCDYVSARGYLPSIRVGSQPYGILPTSAFSRFQIPSSWGDNSYWSALWGMIKSLEKSLKPIVDESVPYKGDKNSSDQHHFVNMLRNNPVSQAFHYRTSINSGNRISPTGFSDALQALISFENNDQLNAESLADKLMEIFDFSSLQSLAGHSDKVDYGAGVLKRTLSRLIHKSRILNLRMLDQSKLYEGVLITPEEANNAVNLGTKDDYISWLRKTILSDAVDDKCSIHHINDLDISGDYQPASNSVKSGALLFFLLRQSILQMLKRKAVDILIACKYLPSRLSARSNHIHYQDYGRSWSILFKKSQYVIDEYNGTDHYHISGFTMYELLLNPDKVKSGAKVFYDQLKSAKKDIDVHIGALEALATCSIAELRNLFAEQVDLSTNRLDAWMLGFVNKKLSQQIGEIKNQCHVASYGYLENVRPAKRNECLNLSVSLKNRVIEESGISNVKVYSSSKNQGAIHAPSLNQAVTAGVLRAGYEAHKNQSDVYNRMAINLSSRRVRNAMQLVEGVRKGQDISALLGYRFERSLHDAFSKSNVELNTLVLPARNVFPYKSLVDDTLNLTAYEKEIQVVNGLELVNQSKALNKNPETSCYTQLLDAAINGEGYFKALLESNKPLTGTSLRVLVRLIIDLMDTLDALSDLAISESVYHIVQGNYVRASAVMNAISGGKALPEIDIINTPVTGTVIQHRTILQLPTNVTTPKTPIAACDPYLNQWISSRLPDFANISIHLASADDNSVEIISLSLAELAIDALDLVVIHGGCPDALDALIITLAKDVLKLQGDYIIVLNQKLNSKQTSLNALKYLLQEILSLLQKSKKLSHHQFSLPDQPCDIVDEYDFEEFVNRLNNIEEILSLPDAVQKYSCCFVDGFTLNDLSRFKQTFIDEKNNADNQVAIYEKMMHTIASIFIDGVIAFPILKMYAQNIEITNNQFFKNLEEHGENKKDLWLASIAKVRSNMSALSNVSLMSDHIGHSIAEMQPIQLPLAEQPERDSWLGIEVEDSNLSADFWEQNRLSLNIYPSSHQSNDTLTAGMMVDEWIEIIPAKKQTTGVAFNIDQPDAAPPQSILLAVNPNRDNSTNWSSDDLLDTVLDTMDLLKLRLLEPDHVNSSILGQIFSGMNIESEASENKKERITDGRLTFESIEKLKPSSYKDKLKAMIKAKENIDSNEVVK